ncbi:MAG TPA: sialate O-acetylesterase [Bacteroidota bacterium]|nr:sialate O-acetylesterase [Bacteroidota bacterium]
MKRSDCHLGIGVIVLSLLPFTSLAGIKLPHIFGDGMVIQRDAEVKVWGWADPGEKVEVSFIHSIYGTTAGSDGAWAVAIPGLKAGGPYEMAIRGSDTVTLKDVLVGDVWLCSGQSNMELPMRRVSPIYGAEIANSANPEIRQFAVPQNYNFKSPQKDLPSGTWKSANPKDVLEFSAVGYFFAKALYDRYKVPIGIINSSLGGSPIESWISEESLKQFPEAYAEAQRMKDTALIQRIVHDDQTRIGTWYRELDRKDLGYSGPHSWRDPKADTAGWGTMRIPGFWADEGLGNINGVVWFRRSVNIPASIADSASLLIMGRIVDADSVFVNGVFVGTTSYQYPPRRYPLPPHTFRAGENTIVIRVINSAGRGGFIPQKEYAIVAGTQSVSLEGDWQFKVGATMDPLASETFIRWKPLGLYNSMIAPILNYRIKGVVWYQGESNTGHPVEYRDLLTSLIKDWRTKFNQGEFPFLIVQLPNFMEAHPQPTESGWAMLREAQARALALPKTGLVVTIDIGEWNDVHPLDKKDVGDRLALSAEKIAYEEKGIVYSGPFYKSMHVEGGRVELAFEHVGGGLVAKGGGAPGPFAIAGDGKKFFWANARIEGDKVIVWSDSVLHPVAVRYAWADNPAGANLFNKEGLPASPFRTDDWTPVSDAEH